MPVNYKSTTIDKFDLMHNVCGWGGVINFIRLYSGKSQVGSISFYPKGQVPASKVDSTLKFTLNYEIDRYQDIIETLRYEKPIGIFVNWNLETNIIFQGYIGTGEEAVGEQEGAGVPQT